MFLLIASKIPTHSVNRRRFKSTVIIKEHYESGQHCERKHSKRFLPRTAAPGIDQHPLIHVLSGTASGSREASCSRASEEAAHDLPSSKVPPPHDASILLFFFWRHTKKRWIQNGQYSVPEKKKGLYYYLFKAQWMCPSLSLGDALRDRGTKWRKKKSSIISIPVSGCDFLSFEHPWNFVSKTF